MKILKTIILSGLCLLLFSTCKRYPDGPNFTLRTIKNRMIGTYDLDKFIVNGIDSTNLLPPCNVVNTIDYGSTNGNYCYRFKSDYKIAGLDGSGDYNFDKDQSAIDFAYIMSYSPNQPLNVRNLLMFGHDDDGQWLIRKLTNNEFWLRKEYHGLVYEIHLKKIHK